MECVGFRCYARRTMPDLLWVLLPKVLWSALAALGFAMLFNTPPRLLLGCVLCGAMGFPLRRLLSDTGVLGEELATLAAAVIVGFLALALARRLRAPATIFSVSGVIPMVPGRFGFEAMIGFVQVVTGSPRANSAMLLVEASVNAIRAILILGAIAVGIAVPTLLFNRRKPVV